MGTQKFCQHCGASLSGDAPGGLCPACMMKVAMGTGTVDDATKPKPHPFTPPAVGELQGRFPALEILEFIGRGGMGAVYKARQKELDRIVAFKILPPDIGHDPAFAERFAREAKAMARLNHPGIVTIHDFGRADGLFYFVMEFVDGITLRHLLQQGRVAPREALAIVPAICDALQYAHDQGIVHRDIKPENILIDRRGRVKVADFGLAKLIASSAEQPAAQSTAASPDLTGAGKVMGTPNYIAPEQISHPQDVDHRADIYSLGVVFYQMLTGELPGKGLEPPSKKVHIDVRLDEIVLRALAKDPERRYQKASALKTQVETISTAEPTQASGKSNQESGLPPVVQPVSTSSAPRLSWAAVAGFCCLFLTLLLALVLIPVGLRAPGIDGGSPPRWITLLAGAPGLLLVLGSIIFGTIGLGHTRRAPERYYGFGLAFLDVFLYPLLLLSLTLTTLAGKNTDLRDTYIFVLVLGVDVVLGLLLWRALRPARSPGTAQRARSPGPFAPVTALVVVTGLGVIGLMTVHRGLSVSRASQEELVHNPQLLREANGQAVLQAAIKNPEMPWAWQELQRRAKQGKLTTEEANQIMDTMARLYSQSRVTSNSPLPWFEELVKTLKERKLVSDERIIACVRAMIGRPSLELPRLRVGAGNLHLICKWPESWHRNFLGYVMLSEMTAVTLDGAPLKLSPGYRAMFRRYTPQFDTSFQLPDGLAPGKHVIRCELRNALRLDQDTTGLAPDAPSADWPPPPSPELASLTDYTDVVGATLTVLAKDEQPIQLTTEPALDPAQVKAIYVSKAFVRNKGGSKTLDIFFETTRDLKVPVSFDVGVALDGQQYKAGAFYCFRENNATTTGGSQLSLEIGNLDPSVREMDVILTPTPQKLDGVLT